MRKHDAPRGGVELLPEIRAICQPELGWDDARWDAEVGRYEAIIAHHYSLPDAVPAWQADVSQANAQAKQRNQWWRMSQIVGGGLAAWGMWRLWRKIHWEAA